MTPAAFFRIALLAPVGLPLLLLPLGMNAVGGLLILSLGFGGVQYVLFAAALYLWIGRVGDPERIRRASLIAPLMFVPVQAMGWLIYCYFQKLANPELVGIWGALFPFAVYVVFIGYIYVGIVNLLYIAIFRRRGNAVEP